MKPFQPITEMLSQPDNSHGQFSAQTPWYILDKLQYTRQFIILISWFLFRFLIFFFFFPSLPRQQTKRQAQPLALPHSLLPQRPSTNQVASRPAEKQDRLTGERGGGRQVRTQRHQMFKNQLRVQERAARWEDEELRRSRARRHEDAAHWKTGGLGRGWGGVGEGGVAGWV